MVSRRALWLDCCCIPELDGLRRIAERHTDVRCVRWSAEVLPAIHTYRPAFACIEYDYPDQARLRAIPLLRHEFPALPVLMLTEYHSEALAVWAFRHRVWDYRVKPIPEQSLTLVLDALARFSSGAQPQGWLAGSLPVELIAPMGHLRKPMAAAPRTAPAIAYLGEHFGEIVRLETVAGLCYLSGSEFSRVFHHEHGVPFRRFLLNYRIAMARDFLAEPHASISQVAYAVGFNDLSHFGRTFRRLVGEPPTRYHQRVNPLGPGTRGANPRDTQKAPT